MNLNQFLVLVILFSSGILMLETVTAQIDPINDIEFIQTGKLFTDKKEFTIINDEKKEKLDNISILVQYTERLYSGQTAKIDIKTFDINQNKLKDFNQNYGYIPNTNIKITDVDKNRQIFSFLDGITNERGFYNAEFIIPKNSQIVVF